MMPLSRKIFIKKSRRVVVGLNWGQCLGDGPQLGCCGGACRAQGNVHAGLGTENLHQLCQPQGPCSPDCLVETSNVEAAFSLSSQVFCTGLNGKGKRRKG